VTSRCYGVTRNLRGRTLTLFGGSWYPRRGTRRAIPSIMTDTETNSATLHVHGGVAYHADAYHGEREGEVGRVDFTYTLSHPVDMGCLVKALAGLHPQWSDMLQSAETRIYRTASGEITFEAGWY